MSKSSKQISNPFSTGSGGGHFEAHVQASYVVLMLTGGYAPSLPCWPITEIKLQGKIDGFDTDDLIVFVERPSTKEKCKLLGQVKHIINITPSDKMFGEVIQAAWNDFNNPSVFTKSKDVIALITSSLSSTDTEAINWVLDQARCTKSADEFYRNVEQTNFSSEHKRRKLNAFQTQLKKANNNSEVTKDALYSFLNHFHLIGYDLGREAGVVLSLLHSHISQFNSNNPKWVWARIVDTVQTWNQNAGTIILEKLPEDLQNVFRQRVYSIIPNEFSSDLLPSSEKPYWDWEAYYSDLIIACLIGSWNENNQADIEIICQLANQEYDTWISKIRKVLQHPQSPLSLINGNWSVNDRKGMWLALGAQIFDDILESFGKCSINVLTECDPRLSLPLEERFSHISHGKILSYSSTLRKGLSEGLALLGSEHNALVNCSWVKAESVAFVAVKEILEGADWVLWGSLNHLLPLLAEAAPNGFLNAVEYALEQSPNPFDELFSKEDSSITGSNYLTGLLWALETLAWDEHLFIRTCVVLGELAAHDPGGNWSNRPSNSLIMILLPWLPQTTASVEKRKVALQTLQKEVPDVAWKLVLKLLPDQHQTSLETHKPLWRNFIPNDWRKSVTNQEYWEQIQSYAELALTMADYDVYKLNELSKYLHKLPQASLNNFLERLSSEAVLTKQEKELLPLWNNLQNFISKHKRFSDAKWALSSDIISTIEIVTEKFAPVNPLHLHHRLFSNREFDLYEDNGEWEEQSKKLEERRQQAVEDILAYGKTDAVIQFSNSVEVPSLVGSAFGAVAQEDSDAAILPSLLGTGNSKISQFISGYIWKRQYMYGWTWVDDLIKSHWSVSQVAEFLCNLPFVNATWERAATWLGVNEGEYWKRTVINPYQTDDSLNYAIDKLLVYGRPNAAINCIYRMYHNNKPIDKSQAVQALLASTTSKEPSGVMDTYLITELIKALQNAPDTNPEDIYRVEWAFLPLLERNSETSSKFLEYRLASEPQFFSEMIGLIYRSNKGSTSVNESSEKRESVAINAWRLLNDWQTPPGLQFNGNFSDENFLQWLNKVKELCTESGHIDIAMTHIGQVLIYCPPDPQGLWINQTVASALNAKDAKEMRSGFSQELFNSRGVHWVDPTGAPERKLAEQYRQKADEVENSGYYRFAVTLRSLAESYDRDASQIVAEHNELN